ncbi:MAG: hypothetical protein ACRDK9_01550 [Solirubrobacterales bacterium]
MDVALIDDNRLAALLAQPLLVGADPRRLLGALAGGVVRQRDALVLADDIPAVDLARHHLQCHRMGDTRPVQAGNGCAQACEWRLLPA